MKRLSSLYIRNSDREDHDMRENMYPFKSIESWEERIKIKKIEKKKAQRHAHFLDTSEFLIKVSYDTTYV